MGIVENTKEVVELIRKLDHQELYEKIVDLRDDIFTLREENLGLRERIRELEATEEIEDDLVKEGNFYYREHENGDRSGPYCPVCWDADRRLINLIKTMSGGYLCKICQKR